MCVINLEMIRCNKLLNVKDLNMYQSIMFANIMLFNVRAETLTLSHDPLSTHGQL